jgi:hypothetical protein
MRRIALLTIAAGFVVPLLAAAPASAQASRTWVSGVGDDVNPCSRTAPCKTFAGAISKTAIAGEINCLDPGGYGTVTITKGMTLNCFYTLGSILASGVPGVTINAPAADKVILRGIQINGIQGSPSVAGTIGVRILSAGAVSIEDSVITQFSQQGVLDARTTGNTKLSIRNSVISFNLAAAVSLTSTGTSFTVLENSHLLNNLNGVSGAATNNVMISRSVLSGNSDTGAVMAAGGQIQISDTVISNNGTGVNATGSIKIGNSDILANGTAFVGTATTYGNNRVTGTIGTAPTAAGGISNTFGQI